MMWVCDLLLIAGLRELEEAHQKQSEELFQLKKNSEAERLELQQIK